MQGLLKIKVLVDEDMVGTSAYLRMEQALQRQHGVIMAATGNRLGTEYEIVRHVYENIPWTQNIYKGKKMYIPAVYWTQEMTDRYRGDADFLTMVILGENWKPPIAVIGGLNIFFTQILQAQLSWSVKSFFITFEEELVHSFDQLASNRLGINFNELFDVKSYDNGVVHGNDARYTRSKYSDLYSIAADTLIKLFPNKTMLELLITPDSEQWVRGSDELDYKVYNLSALNAAFDMGIISSLAPREVDSVSDSGKEFVILTRE